jgi:hypothetical protein
METDPMADNNRSKKMLVRTALVTSTTVATLMSIQNLALLDQQRFDTRASTSDAQTTVVNSDTTTLTTQITSTTSTAADQAKVEIVHSAPSIVILRQSGTSLSQLQQTTASQSTRSIQPPNPVENPASPVIVQQQIIPAASASSGQSQPTQPSRPSNTRSSR